MAQRRSPGVAQRHALVARAASHQSTHRVSDHGDLRDRHGPAGDEVVEVLGELAAVGRDMEPRVVGEVQRRPPIGVAQQRAVGDAAVAPVLLGTEPPGQVVLAQSVEEHDNAPRRGVAHVVDDVGRQAAQRSVVGAQAHRRRERGALLGESIAPETAERAEREPAAGRVERGLGSGVAERPGHRSGGGRQGTHAEPGRGVGKPGDRIVQEADGQRALAQQAEGAFGEATMHVAGHLGELTQRGAHEGSGVANLVAAHRLASRHTSRCARPYPAQSTSPRGTRFRRTGPASSSEGGKLDGGGRWRSPTFWRAHRRKGLTT